MNILLLAPHPFYQDRGTPIAVAHLLRVFSERSDCVDVVTYPEGESVHYTNVRIYRTLSLPFLHNIPPGFSLKKLFCDFLMFFMALKLLMKNRYHIVHSVEESVYIAIILRFIFKIPYIYDMDSSMPLQLIEKFPLLRSLKKTMIFFESIAIRKSEVVIPVCRELAKIAEQQHPKRVFLLPDVSLLNNGDASKSSDSLKRTRGINGLIIMYVGNLEQYQGIDLLLESFAEVMKRGPSAALVIIGGSKPHIEKYEEKSHRLGILETVHFLGPQPTSQLGEYLAEADILVSPRVQGNNTPMKIYSYLHSGKALLATDLSAHTQVLTDDVALIEAPKPGLFSDALFRLIGDEALRIRLGTAGKRLVHEQYSFISYQKKLVSLCEDLEKDLCGQVVAQ